MRHRHIWKITEKTERPSGAELMGRSGLTSLKGHVDPLELLKRPVIVIYRCEKCGSEKVERV